MSRKPRKLDIWASLLPRPRMRTEPCSWKTNMAESQSENNQNIGSCHSCENERQTEETLSNQFEFVELKAVEGDISDISEEERQAGSATKPQRDRPKKKVKKKRKRSKSFTSNDEVSSSDDDTLKTVVAQRKSPQNVDLVG